VNLDETSKLQFFLLDFNFSEPGLCTKIKMTDAAPAPAPITVTFFGMQIDLHQWIGFFAGTQMVKPNHMMVAALSR
jgi:hypothetical protein